MVYCNLESPEQGRWDALHNLFSYFHLARVYRSSSLINCTQKQKKQFYYLLSIHSYTNSNYYIKCIYENNIEHNIHQVSEPFQAPISTRKNIYNVIQFQYVIVAKIKAYIKQLAGRTIISLISHQHVHHITHLIHIQWYSWKWSKQITQHVSKCMGTTTICCMYLM